MTDPAGHLGATSPPAPRRTRDGRIIIGPTIRARYLPGLLVGLPLVSLVLAPIGAAGLQEWRESRLRSEGAGPLTELLATVPVQLLVAAILLWALLAIWALVPMLLTRRIALLDENTGALTLRRGLTDRAGESVSDVAYAVGYADRGYSALLGFGPPRDDGEGAQRQWEIPEIGWDGPSFDGLRSVQAAARLEVSASKATLGAESRRLRRAQAHREMADRIAMPWREEYEHEPDAFQRDFDRARRIIGGKEKP